MDSEDNNQKGDKPIDTKEPSNSHFDNALIKTKQIASEASRIAQQAAQAVKTKYDEAGGVEGIANKTKEVATDAAVIAQQAAKTAKAKYDEAGGAKGLKKSILRDIRANFIPAPEAKGLNVSISRFVNLWKSGWTGQIIIIVVFLIAYTLINAPWGGYGGRSSSSSSEGSSTSPERQMHQYSCKNCGQIVEMDRWPAAQGCSSGKTGHLHQWSQL